MNQFIASKNMGEPQLTTNKEKNIVILFINCSTYRQLNFQPTRIKRLPCHIYIQTPTEREKRRFPLVSESSQYIPHPITFRQLDSRYTHTQTHSIKLYLNFFKKIRVNGLRTGTWALVITSSAHSIEWKVNINTDQCEYRCVLNLRLHRE